MIAITALVLLLFSALMLATMRGALTPTQAGILIAGLVLMELGNNYDPVFTRRADTTGRGQWTGQMRANADVADFLRAQKGFPRAIVANNAFNANWGAIHDAEMWGGSLASVTSNLLTVEHYRPEIQQLFGVAYTLGAQPTPDAGDLVFTGQSGLKVYRNNGAFPRVWPVHKLVEARDAAEADAVMVQHLPDMHGQAVMLSKPPAIEPCQGQDWSVDLLQHSADRMLIRSLLSCPAMIVVSDTYFPGWRARVDGRPAEIYEVNGAMRGVLVPGGLHTVTMRYRPASVLIGAVLTLAGILGAVALGVFSGI